MKDWQTERSMKKRRIPTRGNFQKWNMEKLKDLYKLPSFHFWKIPLIGVSHSFNRSFLKNALIGIFQLCIFHFWKWSLMRIFQFSEIFQVFNLSFFEVFPYRDISIFSIFYFLKKFSVVRIFQFFKFSFSKICFEKLKDPYKGPFSNMKIEKLKDHYKGTFSNMQNWKIERLL